MKFFDSIKIAFSNLFRQKLRTLLTVFSIIIGATLISLVYAVIPGFQKFLDAQLNAFSSPNLIEIYATEERPGQVVLGGLGSGPEEYEEGDSGSVSFEFASFKDKDLEEVRNIDGVKEVYEIPMPSAEYVQLQENDKKLKVSFIFYYPEFLQENLDIVAGRKIKEGDEGKVVISNQYLEAFGVEDPDELIGKELLVHVKQTEQIDPTMALTPGMIQESEPEEKDYNFEIIGVTEKTILSSVLYVSFDDAVEMTKFGSGSDDVLTDNDKRRFGAWVELVDENQANEVLSKIEELGFSGMTYEQSKDVLNDIFGVLTIAFSSFGILAMAVSSLGILNTLIMAVYERTREIGVMKAIGAKRSTIAFLFTVEAALIGLIGGVLGLLIGFGIAELLNFIGHRTILSTFETLDLSNISYLLLLAPIISTVVATVAGIYPAVRASRLDPVRALRYE